MAERPVAPAALGGVDMQAEFFQPALDHQPLEHLGVAQEPVAMAHQHRDQLDVAGVAQDFDHLVGWAQGHLAVGELDIPPGAEFRSQQIELRLDVFEGEFRCSVGVGTEVATAAREIAFRHHADGGAATFLVAAIHLVGGPEARVEPRPGRVQAGACFPRDRPAQQPPEARGPDGASVG